jgi:adenylosuccinate lyase
LNVHEEALARNLAMYSPFASTERLLMALVKAGADRQEMHEHLRDQAMQAWEIVREGKNNPLAENISSDSNFQRYLPAHEIQSLMRAEGYTGIAAERALSTAENILQTVGAK